MPEAGTAEARDFVMRAADEFRQTQQAKYAAASSEPLGNVNRGAMALCGAIEAVGVAIYCVHLPPADPVNFAYRLATGFIFGVAISLSVRVKGFGKRHLIPLIPLFALIGGGDVFFQKMDHGDHNAAFSYGMLLGIALLTFGYTRWRRVRR